MKVALSSVALILILLVAIVGIAKFAGIEPGGTSGFPVVATGQDMYSTASLS